MDKNLSDSAMVYVDLSALENWNIEMKRIADAAIVELDYISHAVNQLNDYWEGNISAGFIENSSELINKAKKCHNKMQDVPNFLIDVINTMSNQ